MLITACRQPRFQAADQGSRRGPGVPPPVAARDLPERVAVVGTGCSAIQVAGDSADRRAIERYHTSGLTIPRLDFATALAQRVFARVPALQRLDRAAAFGFYEFGTLALTSQPRLRPAFRRLARHQITKTIKDPELRRKVTPVDEVGCKRIMPTDAWYPTLTRSNVELLTDPITMVTRRGIQTQGGFENAVDVIVFATGFKTHGFVTPWSHGSGDRASAGLGPRATRVSRPQRPGFLNLFLLYGPNIGGGGFGDLHGRGWDALRDLSARCSWAGRRSADRDSTRVADTLMQSCAPHSQERCGIADARIGMSMRTDTIPTSGRGPLRATAGERPESIPRHMRSAPGPARKASARRGDCPGTSTTLSAAGGSRVDNVCFWTKSSPPGRAAASRAPTEGKVDETHQHQSIMSSTVVPMTAGVSEAIGCRDIVVVGASRSLAVLKISRFLPTSSTSMG